MKKLLFALFILSSVYGYSQNSGPVIKKGSKLNYSITTDQGSIALVIAVDSLSPSYINFKWSTQDVGSGTWEIKEKSLQTANTGRWGQLAPDTKETMPDDQSAVVLSKAQWTSIQKDKTTALDMVKYTVKKNPQQLKLNGKDADVIYLENEDASSKLWILNNSAFPAIVKITGNKAGADAELKSVD